MAGYLEDARRGAFWALGLQCVATLAAGALGFLLGGGPAGVAALLGGLVCVGANLALTVWVFAGESGRDPQRFLLRMVLGEMSKFAVAGVMFFVAITKFQAGLLPLMSGYFASLVAYWAGLLKSNIGRMK